MAESAFQLRSAEIAHRRLTRITTGTAATCEIDDSPQLAEYEAMRAATSAYLTALDLQAAALEFHAGSTIGANGRWPDARDAARSKNAAVGVWHARLTDGEDYERLLQLRKAFEHRWFRRDVVARAGGGPGTISTAVLESGEEIPFDPDELDPIDNLVIDQFILAAYLLVYGQPDPPGTSG